MRGSIAKRSKGSYSLVLELGRDQDGKRKQKWITVRGTRKDAERRLAEALHQLETGLYVEPSKMTVSEFLERWLSHAQTRVAPKTLERYRQLCENTLMPSLGGLSLTKLHPLEIQRCYAKALESGRSDGKGGLSKRTVLHVHRLLHTALEQAVKWQLLARNPSDAVEPPSPDQAQMVVIDEARGRWLLEAVAGTKFHVPVILAVTTGMRRGEVLALTWADIDFEAGTATVGRSVEQTKGGLRFKRPKTRRSFRSIALPAVTLAALAAHKEAQDARRMQLGAIYEDQDLICCQENGALWSPDSFSSSFKKLCVSLGIPGSFHTLRHAHASHLLRARINPKVVSERLGHCNVNLTLNTYAHVLPGMQEEAAIVTNGIFDPTGRIATRKPQ